MQAVIGQLTILNAHTPQIQVFWDGAPVSVHSLRIDWEDGEQRVRIKVPANELVHDAMSTAGIIIKLENNHG